MAVSVVIPAHNLETMIGDAVQSVLDQTYPVKEILVSDDGSTDRTAEIAESLGATVLRGPKANGNVARNRGARAATGDVVFFLDGDDWWHPTKVETHLRAHTLHPEASFVYEPAVVFENEAISDRLIGDLGPESPEWSHFLLWTSWASGSCFSVSREHLDRFSLFDEGLIALQDVDFWVRLAHEQGPAYRIAAPYTYYRIVPRSVSRAPKNVAANLENVLKGWPFLSAAQRLAFRQQTFLTAARFVGLKQGLPYLGLAGWPVLTPKFWKVLARMTANSLRSA